MNNRGIVSVIIFTLFLVLAIVLGNMFLSFVLQRPIDEVPTIAKVLVHGISLGFIFYVAKKVLIR